MTMRIVIYMVAATAVLPAAAQQGPVPSGPSVAGYLCTFAGKCDGVEASSETRDAPKTKGFRLARSTPEAAKDAAPAIEGRAVNRESQAVSTSRRRVPAIYGSSSVRETKRANLATANVLPAVAAARVPGAARRADLMIGFELNSDRLTAVGRESARVFAQSLLTPELRSKRFLIEGHTDERGGRGVNMPLSMRRAARVAEFLEAEGVDPARLVARGMGSLAPLPGLSVTNPANRRVEAELIS